MEKVIRDDIIIEVHEKLPVLPLKETVVFPYMIYPLLVGREPSMKALQEALMNDKLILLVAQKDVLNESPGPKDLYRVGVVARILQILRLPNGLVKVLVEGLVRVRVVRYSTTSDFLCARVEVIPETFRLTPEIQAGVRHVVSLFKEYVLLNRELPDELLLSVENVDNPRRVADFVAAHVTKHLKEKQRILEASSIKEELFELAKLLNSEKEILQIERNIEDQVRDRLQKSQRNFYLQEQLRVIKQELGEEEEPGGEFQLLEEKILKANMPKEAHEKALEELEKLRFTPSVSPEYTVIRNYLDWLVAMPWRKRTKDNLNLKVAQRILDEDHYGLEKPKERILEHLAVMKLVKKLKGPILCLVGPPGVGKTSLGRSIARTLGRKFVRVSLGGIRDEAEIRGHRRTYIGSMPGRIVQSIKKAGTKNPVFLLDEVDKMSVDFRGDPSAALLEVLDPEQNKSFSDHYLEVEFDLSEVMFITTANVRHNIPEPLLDRMEVIELPGYMEYDKLEIAKQFLIPKQLRENGLSAENLQFSDQSILKIIRQYTREAGVRNLERNISNVCRKVARKIVSNPKVQVYNINTRNLENFLGVPKYTEKMIEGEDLLGSATGLAWTEFGGDLLMIEVTLMQGKGTLTLTGKLGEVMKESAQAALSYIRSNAKEYDVDPNFFEEQEVHIHVPEGAIPKDGPSAGITMAIAMLSAITQRKVCRDVAMTGEITLRGNVLPVGGLNEKLLAAQRAGIKRVIIPQENEKDLGEISPKVLKGLEIIKVKTMEEVVAHAMCSNGVLQHQNK
ncbi:endopeptidase La [candidate division KSB1 bacterium]|nr:endopeptidase La [bacterium]RKY92975.1 MAG: endopeptidase La [candidate division KSB1 bacterium]